MADRSLKPGDEVISTVAYDDGKVHRGSVVRLVPGGLVEVRHAEGCCVFERAPQQRVSRCASFLWVHDG